MNLRSQLLAGAVVGVLALVLLLLLWRNRTQQSSEATAPVVSETQPTNTQVASVEKSATSIHAHNLLLRKGPQFRVYVRWFDGQLAGTRSDINPSFDRPESFALDIRTGVIRANIGDIGKYLNSALVDSPLKNVTLLADGPNLKMTGTVHKIVPLPVQVTATVSAAPDDQVRVHIAKISVLKLPVKGLLGLFHVSAADLVKTNIGGVKVEGNDLLLDAQKLLPPPHIRGQLTQVSVDSPDIQATFGNAAQDMERVELWRNFFSLQGGTIDFGNLTMHPVNITIIDISKNPWFDLDLINYRQQFGSGYTRMTSDSGLQIFVPDRREIGSRSTATNDGIQWFKDRNIPPPPQITAAVRH